MYSYQYKLEGVTCSACGKIIKKKISGIDGVTEAITDESGNLGIKSERELEKNEIVEALKDTDYKIL